jgi:hypothetical protein
MTHPAGDRWRSVGALRRVESLPVGTHFQFRPGDYIWQVLPRLHPNMPRYQCHYQPDPLGYTWRDPDASAVVVMLC